MVMNTADTEPDAVVVGAPVRIEVRAAGGQHLAFAIVTDTAGGAS